MTSAPDPLDALRARAIELASAIAAEPQGENLRQLSAELESVLHELLARYLATPPRPCQDAEPPPAATAAPHPPHALPMSAVEHAAATTAAKPNEETTHRRSPS